MIQININLASKPFVNHRKFLLIAGSLLVVLASVSLWNYFQYRTHRELHGDIYTRLEKDRREIDRLGRELGSVIERLSRAENGDFLDVVSYVNVLINRRTFSWTQLLNDLETLIPAGVQVVSLKPKILEQGVGIEITVNSRTGEDMIGFISRLETSGKFDQVTPIMEGLSKTPGFAGKQITLSASYKGQG
ncbi:MAG: PilN domain-containing protein [Acidobacteriota bacterium]